MFRLRTRLGVREPYRMRGRVAEKPQETIAARCSESLAVMDLVEPDDCDAFLSPYLSLPLGRIYLKFVESIYLECLKERMMSDIKFETVAR